jgi:pectate lyase
LRHYPPAGGSDSGDNTPFSLSDYTYTPASTAAAYTDVLANAGAGNKSNYSTSTLPDGFATLGTGTTGGGSATAVTVTSRKELVAALKTSSPRVIVVSGTIDLCSDDSGNHLEETYFYKSSNGVTYNPDSYYAEAQSWSSIDTSSDQEKARSASANTQKAVVVLSIPSNTTILGASTGAVVKNGSFKISGASNIIIRNIDFQDAYDYFPQWDPTDNWNSEYDIIGIESSSSNIWIDHCTLSDGARPDNHSEYPISGKYRQHHDGVIDITKGSNYVTVSYCCIHNHEKTHLIGSSDSTTSDSGKLKVTFHHNYYYSVGQRLPRVRYGVAHCYNNVYQDVTSYVFGIGVESTIYAQANTYISVASKTSTFTSSSHKSGAFYETN